MFVILLTVTALRGCNGDCNNLNVSQLLPCQPAASVRKPTNPSPACCNVINSFNANDVQCLCSFIRFNNGSFLRSFGISPRRCTKLPKLCNVTLPTNC
ncbi:putative lipid-transfer protein DIR1 [Bienertia sinuspersici]